MVAKHKQGEKMGEEKEGGGVGLQGY